MENYEELNLTDFVDIEGLYRINRIGDIFSIKSNKILKS